MRILGFSSHALTIGAAAAMLAACGGSQPLMSTQSPVPQARRSGATLAGSGDLLYVSISTRGGDVVQAFDYPSGHQAFTLQTKSEGLCSDTNGNVFITDYEGGLSEYAHGGGSPIDEIVDTNNYPQGCAVDPVSGNLAAVGSYETLGAPNVTIFSKTGSGYGAPMTYTDSSVSSFVWCTYDGSGDLFTAASTRSGAALYELPAGGKSLTHINLPFQTSQSVGSIQWDGQYLAMANPIYGKGKKPATIYQLQVSGSTATIINTIKLKSPKNRNDMYEAQLWIQDGTIVYPESHKKNVGLWNYPQGGSPTKTIKVNFYPVGITVSVGG
jgi:hypothetical protein